MSEIRLYLVAYDVSSPRRWRRVHKTLKRAGAWAQLSAFFCRMTEGRCRALERELRGHLNADEDRLIVADLGPADQAGKRLSSLGAITLPQPPKALIL